MRSFRSKPVGWANDNHRHYLAAKYGSAGGVKHYNVSKEVDAYTKKGVHYRKYEVEDKNLLPLSIEPHKVSQKELPVDYKNVPMMFVVTRDKGKRGEKVWKIDPRSTTYSPDMYDAVSGRLESEEARRVLNRGRKEEASRKHTSKDDVSRLKEEIG